MYPNPVTDYFVIETGQLKDQLNIEIFDMNGKLVYKVYPTNNLNNQKIDVSSFSSGMYQLKIGSNQQYKLINFMKK